MGIFYLVRSWIPSPTPPPPKKKIKKREEIKVCITLLFYRHKVTEDDKKSCELSVGFGSS